MFLCFSKKKLMIFRKKPRKIIQEDLWILQKSWKNLWLFLEKYHFDIQDLKNFPVIYLFVSITFFKFIELTKKLLYSIFSNEQLAFKLLIRSFEIFLKWINPQHKLFVKMIFFQKFNPTPELHIYILRYSCEIKDLFFNDL